MKSRLPGLAAIAAAGIASLATSAAHSPAMTGDRSGRLTLDREHHSVEQRWIVQATAGNRLDPKASPWVSLDFTVTAPGADDWALDGGVDAGFAQPSWRVTMEPYISGEAQISEDRLSGTLAATLQPGCDHCFP